MPLTIHHHRPHKNNQWENRLVEMPGADNRLKYKKLNALFLALEVEIVTRLLKYH